MSNTDDDKGWADFDDAVQQRVLGFMWRVYGEAVRGSHGHFTASELAALTEAIYLLEAT